MDAVDLETSVETVEAELDYLVEGSTVNRRYVAPGAEFNTGRYEPRRVRVRNGRPVREALTLDRVGFTLAEHRSEVRDFFDQEEVERVYPGEVVETIKRLTGASRVALMGWMVRTSDGQELRAKQGLGYRRGSLQPPASDVHVDMCPDRAERLAKTLYEKIAPDGPGYRRFVATSLWRTFSEPPQDWPLAVCEGASLEDDEGVTNTMVLVDALPDEATMYGPLEGEHSLPAASVFRFAAHHRWWYFPNMSRDECIVLKFYDSDRSRTWRAPHTAFRDPSAVDARTRRSIEFRSVAFFD